MNRDLENLAARAAPALFVVLWSTGFIGTKYVLHNAEPLTYLAIRMVLVVALMAVIAAIARPRWPDRMARRQCGAVYRGRVFFQPWRVAVRDRRGALDRRIRALPVLAGGGAVDRLDRAVVLADPAFRGHIGREPVLSGARGDRGDGIRVVRRTARQCCHRRDARLRGGSV